MDVRTTRHFLFGMFAIAMALPSGGCSQDNRRLFTPEETGQLSHRSSAPITKKPSDFYEPQSPFSRARDVLPEDLKVSTGDYVICRGDLVRLEMTDVTPGLETGKNQRVRENGCIEVPLMGLVPAAGLTEHQLEMEINLRYKDAGMTMVVTIGH